MKADDIIEALAIAEYGNRETWPIMPEGGRDIFRQDAREVRNRLSAAGFVVLPKEELEAALKPFGDVALEISKRAQAAAVREGLTAEDEKVMIPDDMVAFVSGVQAGAKVTYGDLRRSAALLAAITEETKNAE